MVSELVPVAALLTIRQRRRAGWSFRYPMFLLIAAAALSRAAQLAVANPGGTGWVLSAVPSLAFMALSKLVLSGHSMSETTAQSESPRLLPDVPEQPVVSTPAAVKVRKRRPIEETRKLAAALLAAEPALSREEVADKLGVSTRRLRTVLSTV